MNIESSFTELGIDAVTGTNILAWLNIAPEELSFPQRFAKLQSVIEYLKPFPTDTQRFLIGKATRAKQVDRLDHMFEYTMLLREKTEFENIGKIIDQEKSMAESDPDRLKEVKVRERELKKELERIGEEIYLFEK